MGDRHRRSNKEREEVVGLNDRERGRRSKETMILK
jgi:hypothetical protein